MPTDSLAPAHGVDHYENFPVASWLTPARLRPAIRAIYWFARTADDIADEGDASPQRRLAELATYREDLMACAQGQTQTQTLSAHWPQVFQPLKHIIAEHQLPLSLLDALLQAFEQDVRYTAAGRWYVHHGELLDYCALSANPIGRLLLHLYGVKGDEALQASDAICSALQLINFWQDLSRDIPRGRHYLPLAGIVPVDETVPMPLAGQQTPDAIKVIADYVEKTPGLMQKGAVLPALVQKQVGGFDGWRLALELRCVMQGGLRIVEKIRALGYRTMHERPKLGVWDAVLIFWRALRMK
jgi:hydroxysqualene synthase